MSLPFGRERHVGVAAGLRRRQLLGRPGREAREVVQLLGDGAASNGVVNLQLLVHQDVSKTRPPAQLLRQLRS